MNKAVIYGAGSIGRGFIGHLLSESNYEIIFIDTNVELVNRINTSKSYPISIVSDYGDIEVIISNVNALNAHETEAIEKVISVADIIFTAVGVNALPYIAMPITKGLLKRWSDDNTTPLNIIICENMVNADTYLRELVEQSMLQLIASDLCKDFIDKRVGFVLASVGRMVPVMTVDELIDEPLRVCVEAYNQLPVDQDAIKGIIPNIVNLLPFSPFNYLINRKIYIHNMGHAMTAYLGFLKEYTYIWEAIEDDEIKQIVTNAMMSSALALSIEYNMPFASIAEHVDDLIGRFGNRKLGDTIKRVGRDLQRKLSVNDRLIGAYNLCVKNNTNTQAIIQGIVAALQFDDPIENQTSKRLRENDVKRVLIDVCGLPSNSKIVDLILSGLDEHKSHTKKMC